MAVTVIALHLVATFSNVTLRVTGVDTVGRAEGHRAIAVGLSILGFTLPLCIAQFNAG